MGRCIVVGDVQGCLTELIMLAEKVQFVHRHDRLILAGDLLDRGPDSAGVVAWAIGNGVEAIMGNHEESHLRFKKHDLKAAADPKYKNPMKPRPPGEPHRVVYDSLDKMQWEWLMKLPLYLHINDHWTVVHAGCFPGVEIEKQKPDHLMRLRYFRKGPPLKMVSDLKEQMSAETHCYWTEMWTGPRSLVYGHHVEKRGAVLTTPLNNPQLISSDEVLPGYGNAQGCTLGIDTGACFGGRLTAAIFEGDKVSIESVPATGKWADLHDDKWDGR